MKDPTLIHPECLPIRIPEDDPFFSKFGQRCMSFIRSMPAPRLDCNFGFGEQVNPALKCLLANVINSRPADEPNHPFPG